MKYTTVHAARAEALRFIEACDAYIKVAKAEHSTPPSVIREWAGQPTKESGAVKHASILLTRKLADLRLNR